MKGKRWRPFPICSIIFLLTVALCVLEYGVPPGHAADVGNLLRKGGMTIIDLQPYRQTSSVPLEGAGRAALTNLNPSVNAWYLLELARPGAPQEMFHLENAKPEDQKLLLDDSYSSGVITMQGKDRFLCDLWGKNSPHALKDAAKTGAAYRPLCQDRIYLRNKVQGHQTPLEKVTDFLRKEVPRGEQVIALLRDTVFNYLYKEKAEEKPETAGVHGLPPAADDGGPAPARMNVQEANRLVKPDDLGLETAASAQQGLRPGTWQPLRGNPHIYVSVIAPKWISPEIMASYKNMVKGLDGIESGGLVYLVAFDLGQFNLKYALGTVHPELGWSAHVRPQMLDRSLPGPDGIATGAPLLRTGLINPLDGGKTVAAFTGGFKRYHGAFKYGPLSLINHGSHYGFLEKGVIFSKLQPGLATLYALNDGPADIKTWAAEDDGLLPKVAYARQNGVPLLDGFDQTAHLSVPGPLVGQWGPGNWSGSANNDLRTMRGGIGLQEFKGRRFLIYAFFWSATPSAMARVFQAYQVRYAMLLDMNALVHTYCAIYERRGTDIYVRHLIKGMSEADISVKGRRLPRFLAYPDDRDFFYLTRKEAP